MTEDERMERREFAMRESERCAREASQARAELGADRAADDADALADPLMRWREDVAKRDRAAHRARAELRETERVESVAAIETRIRSELSEMFERRVSEQAVEIPKMISDVILPLIEKQADKISEMARVTARHEERLTSMVAHALARDGEVLPPTTVPGPRPRPRRPHNTAVN